MFECKKCKSNRIKTRTNRSYGKSVTTPVMCKECGSTEIEKLVYDKRRGGFRRRDSKRR